MGLSDDQKAMLRLLAQREQGYEDIAALMGLSVAEVRAKVGEALAQLEDEGAPAPKLPPEPEPPKAEPEPPAPAPTPEPPRAEPPAAAPTPEPPAAPAPKTEPSPAPAASTPPSSTSGGSGPKLSLPSSTGARAAVAAVAAALVILVIVLVSGGGGGSDSSTSAGTKTIASETASNSGGGSETATGGTNPKEVTKAVLTPVDGSDASGEAVFGRVKKSLALQVEAEGLEPAPKGSGTTYTIWVAQSAARMLPLASTAVPQTGKIVAQFAVPVEVLAYLANETFTRLVVTKTSASALNASLKVATKEERAPKYTGEEVLRGTITGPIIGAAKKQQE